MGLVEPSHTAVFWMLFGFAIICFSLGIFIAWYEYKQCNGIQPLIPDYHKGSNYCQEEGVKQSILEIAEEGET